MSCIPPSLPGQRSFLPPDYELPADKKEEAKHYIESKLSEMYPSLYPEEKHKSPDNDSHRLLYSNIKKIVDEKEENQKRFNELCKGIFDYSFWKANKHEFLSKTDFHNVASHLKITKATGYRAFQKKQEFECLAYALNKEKWNEIQYGTTIITKRNEKWPIEAKKAYKFLDKKTNKFVYLVCKEKKILKYCLNYVEDEPLILIPPPQPKKNKFKGKKQKITEKVKKTEEKVKERKVHENALVTNPPIVTPSIPGDADDSTSFEWPMITHDEDNYYNIDNNYNNYYNSDDYLNSFWQ